MSKSFLLWVVLIVCAQCVCTPKTQWCVALWSLISKMADVEEWQLRIDQSQSEIFVKCKFIISLHCLFQRKWRSQGSCHDCQTKHLSHRCARLATSSPLFCLVINVPISLIIEQAWHISLSCFILFHCIFLFFISRSLWKQQAQFGKFY